MMINTNYMAGGKHLFSQGKNDTNMSDNVYIGFLPSL